MDPSLFSCYEVDGPDGEMKREKVGRPALAIQARISFGSCTT